MTTMMMTMMMFIYHNDYCNPIISIPESSLFFLVTYTVLRAVRSDYRGGIQDFFFGGGALLSCSTSTPINHMVFFCFFLGGGGAEYQLY